MCYIIMVYLKRFISINLLILIYLRTSVAQLDDDNCYAAAFTDKVKGCEDFENNVFQCHLDLGISSDDAESGLTLSGDLNLVDDIDDEFEIELNVWKDLGATKQFMYNVDGNLCNSLKKNDTPWAPLGEVLLAADCPVRKGVYQVKDLVMSLEFAKSVLNHEFCGDYIAVLSIKTLTETIACHEIGIVVEEVPCK